VYLALEYKDVVPINLAVLQRMRDTLSRPEGVYFMVLKQASLFLYRSEEQEHCEGIASIKGHLVDIFPHSLLLDEIFKKEFPIRVCNPTGSLFGSQSTAYVYAANGSEKEDWLYALRRAAVEVQPEIKARREALDFPGFIRRAAETLEATPSLDATGELISALVGRLIFNVHRADEVTALIRERFDRKVAALPKPAMLGPLVLEELSLGQGIPVLSNGKLHSLSHNHELVGSIDLLYPGGLALRISTSIAVTAGIVIPVTVDVVVRRLAGRLMLKIKGPPSDRLWFGFYRLPDYDIHVLPAVSSRALSWNFVQTIIAKQIDDAMREFVVLPNMDDINIPPLLAGSMFVGERPFELGPLPQATIDAVLAKGRYSALALSHAGESAGEGSPQMVSLESIPSSTAASASVEIIESILRKETEEPAQAEAERKVFIAVNEGIVHRLQQRGTSSSASSIDLRQRNASSLSLADPTVIIHQHQE
jgi:hypothetical protein